MNKTGFYRKFYTKHISQYLQSQDFTGGSGEEYREIFQGISQKDCRKWVEIPIQYLSTREALALGIYLKSKMPSGKEDQALRYLEYAVFNSDSQKNLEVKYYALMALGIFYFDEALKESSNKRKKILKICRYYFDECQLHKAYDELLALHQTVLKIAKGDKEKAVKFLVQASRKHTRPQILFHALAIIYWELGMEKISQFYCTRRDHYKEESLQSCA